MSPLPADARPQALLFDLGGVLIDIDFKRAFQAWAPLSSLPPGQLATAFRFDALYEQHERGEITAARYFEHLAGLLSLEPDLHRIEQGWNAVFVGEIAGTLAWVRAARKQWPCSAFTNTNATHQARWSALFPGVAGAFDRVFSSHEIGLRKPDRAAFEFIARELGVPMGAILFFDDLLANVEGAAAAGLQTVYVRSPEDVRQALLGLGCVLDEAVFPGV